MACPCHMLHAGATCHPRAQERRIPQMLERRAPHSAAGSAYSTRAVVLRTFCRCGPWFCDPRLHVSDCLHFCSSRHSSRLLSSSKARPRYLLDQANPRRAPRFKRRARVLRVWPSCRMKAMMKMKMKMICERVRCGASPAPSPEVNCLS